MSFEQMKAARDVRRQHIRKLLKHMEEDAPGPEGELAMMFVEELFELFDSIHLLAAHPIAIINRASGGVAG